MAYRRRVKCLHAHYAHYLYLSHLHSTHPSSGSEGSESVVNIRPMNPVGQWIHELLNDQYIHNDVSDSNDQDSKSL